MWNGNGHENFEQGIIELLPILELLSNRGSKIVWMDQYPAMEFTFWKASMNSASEKIENYNKIARRVFKYVTTNISD